MMPYPSARNDDPVNVGPHTSGVMALLVLCVAVAFFPTLENDFVNWDDYENFTTNEEYRGLGWPQLKWAWTNFLLGVYQPLAWMLLSVEYAVCQLDPRGYHLVSVAFHAVNAALLYRVVLRLLARGGGRAPWAWAWAGLAVAAFALHPLRVEPVAWVSCQPYLPAALFCLLTVLAYLRAADAADRGDPTARRWLAAAVGLYAAALLSKAVAVSLPAVLVVLDVYPLRRLGGGRRSGRVWLEKLPFVGLSVVFMLLAVKAKGHYGTLVPLANYGVGPRTAQSCYGLWFYLIKTVVPIPLTAYYALPARLALDDAKFLPYVVAAAAVTAAAVGLRRRWPWFSAAWAAYLLMLAPNLGIVTIGQQIAADRYSYLPMMAWVPVLAAGMGRLARPGRPSRAAVAGTGLVICGVLTALTWSQCQTWRDTTTLFGHAIAHAEVPSASIYNNAGLALLCDAKLDQAAANFQEALRIDPDNVYAINNTGLILERLGRMDEAKEWFRRALAVDPSNAKARTNLIRMLVVQNRPEEAEGEFKALLRDDPDNTSAMIGLAWVYERTQRLEKAAPLLKAALQLDPKLEDARRTLADLARHGLR